MTDGTSMELDGCEAAGSSLEAEQGAIAEPRWLWEAIAAEESPSSVEMEDAETDPGASQDAGPDAGNEQKGGGSATLSGDDQRDDSVLDGLDGEFAKLRHMIQESAERTENETFGKLDLMEAQTKNAGRGRGSECSRAAGVRWCRKAATRSRRNRGTAEGRKQNVHGRLSSLGRRAARISAFGGRRLRWPLLFRPSSYSAYWSSCSSRLFPPTIRAAAGAATSGKTTAPPSPNARWKQSGRTGR